jgi:hypothetical protein
MLAAGFEPLEPYPGSNASQWKCRCLKCEREILKTYASVRRGAGCPWCAGQRTDPEAANAAMLRANLQPLEAYKGANRPWRSRCLACDTEVTPTYANVRNGQGCRACAKKWVDAQAAKAAMVEAGLEPLEDYPGANVPWRCRCLTCARETSPTRSSVLRGSRCGWCAGKRVDADEAVSVMRASGLEPLVAYPGANEPWPAQCITCGQIVSPHLTTVRAGGGCVWCARRRVDAKAAVEVMRSAGFEPQEPYPGAGAKWRCLCSVCGRESTPRYSTVTKGHRCAWCAGQRVDAVVARDLMLASGMEPLVDFPGGKTRWKCRCLSCERVIYPTYANARKGRRCRYCAPRGVDYSAPGIVYLLVNYPNLALKVGMTTVAAREDRVQQHLAHGWEAVQTWNVPTGTDAEAVEEAVLRWWRVDLGVAAALAREHMPQGGWSETASLRWVSADATAARISSLVRQLAVDKDNAPTTR